MCRDLLQIKQQSPVVTIICQLFFDCPAISPPVMIIEKKGSPSITVIIWHGFLKTCVLLLHRYTFSSVNCGASLSLGYRPCEINITRWPIKPITFLYDERCRVVQMPVGLRMERVATSVATKRNYRLQFDVKREKK